MRLRHINTFWTSAPGYVPLPFQITCPCIGSDNICSPVQHKCDIPFLKESVGNQTDEWSHKAGKQANERHKVAKPTL